MEFETVVETISTENNPKSFDNQIKAFYNTYSDVVVIGYSTQKEGDHLVITTTLMGNKAIGESFLKKVEQN